MYRYLQKHAEKAKGLTDTRNVTQERRNFECSQSECLTLFTEKEHAYRRNQALQGSPDICQEKSEGSL